MLVIAIPPLEAILMQRKKYHVGIGNRLCVWKVIA